MNNNGIFRVGKTIAAIIILVLSGATFASADEILKYKTVSHSTGAFTMDPADGVEGHLVGAAKFVGVSLFDDGRVATVNYLTNFDYVSGSGTYVTSETFRFSDGSIIRMKNSGAAKLDGKVTNFSDGKTEVLGGEGKYKGAIGSGEFHGARITPITEGGDSYFDGTMTLKTP